MTASRRGVACRLNGYQPTHTFGLHVFATPALDDLTPCHDQVLVGQFFGKVVELLHQQNRHVTTLKPQQRVQAGIAYVPQGREIFPRLTVEENLLMGLSRFPAREAREVPAFIYELFPVLEQMKQRRGGDLSGGQQQQLAIGRALASRPRLLILDEPTEGIQPSVIKEIGAVIRRLAERGDMAILLVEQFYDFAEELADQYLVMARGEIIQRGRGENMQAEGVRGLVTI